ncbi:MAG: hypothetical protein EA379_06105 [Phycisphaerales bacterium]|nr:MAG: hypothetical protein EA379_06105 [Phycisphaerales bacterium]
MRAHDLLEASSRLAGFDETPADSCVAHDAGAPVRRVCAGINATTGDLLVAREMGCDTFLLHHPLAGDAKRRFHLVLARMVELMEDHGVPPAPARAAVEPLARRARFNDHLSDWGHLADAAKRIGITLLNVHLAADELGRLAMLEALRPLPEHATVADVVRALGDVPELAHPENEIIVVPESDAPRPAGRIAVMHAGGTNGGASVAEALFAHGVGTVAYIHLSGEDAGRLEARAREGHAGSLVVTGHMASDAIGMNLLLQWLREEHAVECVAYGGLAPFDGLR